MMSACHETKLPQKPHSTSRVPGGDVLLLILRFLLVDEIVRFGRVNLAWRKAAESPALWRWLHQLYSPSTGLQKTEKKGAAAAGGNNSTAANKAAVTQLWREWR